VVRFEDIAKSFGAVQALRGVSLSLQPGEVRGLVGENGSGKSTLLRVLSGEVEPDVGTVSLDGEELAPGDFAARHRAGIGVVSQEPRVCEQMSVTENVWLGRLPSSGGVIRWGEARAGAASTLTRMGFDMPARAPVASLNQDARHVVDVARVVAQNYRVVAFDETTASLSGDAVMRIFELIREIKAAGGSCFFISHRLPEVFEICDTITVLRDGQVAGELAAADATEDSVIRLMVGRSFEDHFARQPGTPGEVRLETRGLQAGKLAPIDLTVRAGEILGVGGLVGSGRSTLLKAIYGAIPRSGEILCDGAEIRGTVEAAIRARMGFVPEDRRAEGLAMEASVEENMMLTRLAKRGLLGLTKSVRASADLPAVAGRLRLKAPSLDAPVRTLSGGNQQKVVLGRWLIAGVSVLLLDEPTRGIDIGAKREIYALLDELAADGMAIVVVSSELPELIGLCDRIAILREGRLVREFGHAPSEEDLALAMAASVSHATG
jgi:ABC-type sugar transport system ATPase subunit